MRTDSPPEPSISTAVSFRPSRSAAAHALLILAAGMIAGCPNNFFPQDECATNEDCVDHVGRPTCVGGLCVECTEAPDCDDEDACTTDTCDANHVCANTPVSCDDGDGCTVDSCDAAAGCTTTPVECEGGAVCVDGECACICASDADCDDGDACTTVVCAECACVSAPVDCDDGDECTIDTCDPVAGCSYTPKQCPEMATCVDGYCLYADEFCYSDSDCDDGVFCNGIERCNSEGACVQPLHPCPCSTDLCDESARQCICADEVGMLQTTPLTSGFRLTFAADKFTGGCSGDSFNGSLEVIGGTIFQTLNDADSLDGGCGLDTVTAQLRNGGITTPALLENIETVNLEVTDTKAATVNLSSADVVTTVSSSNSRAALFVTDVRTPLTNVNVVNTGADLTVRLRNDSTFAPLAGGSDSLTVTLSRVTDGGTSPVLTVGPATAGSGYETIHLLSQGTAPNSIQQLTGGLGSSLRTITIAGNQSLNIGAALDSTVTLVDATLATGSINIHLGGTGAMVFGSTANDVLIGAPGADRVDGGAGDDLIVGGGEADVFIGGTGADVFALDQANTLGALRISRNTINDFVAGTDKFRVNNAAGTANVGVLTGSDAFATSAAIQEHSTSGGLVVNSAARMVRIAVETVSECSTDGASVLDAAASGAGISGTITAPPNRVILFSVFNGASTCLYLGAADTTGAGDSAVTQAEIVLVATLVNFNHANWTFGDFLP